jgi:hypothetical protein
MGLGKFWVFFSLILFFRHGVGINGRSLRVVLVVPPSVWISLPSSFGNSVTDGMDGYNS